LRGRGDKYGSGVAQAVALFSAFSFGFAACD